MRAKVVVFSLLLVMALASCYNPYKGFDGVDDKGMGRTPPSLELSDSKVKSQKKAQKRYKKMMKKRRKEMGTPDDKSKKRDLNPF